MLRTDKPIEREVIIVEAEDVGDAEIGIGFLLGMIKIFLNCITWCVYKSDHRIKVFWKSKHYATWMNHMSINILWSWRKEYLVHVLWRRNKWNDISDWSSPQPGINIKRRVSTHTGLTLWQAVFPDHYTSVHLIFPTSAQSRYCSGAFSRWRSRGQCN